MSNIISMYGDHYGTCDEGAGCRYRTWLGEWQVVEHLEPGWWLVREVGNGICQVIPTSTFSSVGWSEHPNTDDEVERK